MSPLMPLIIGHQPDVTAALYSALASGHIILIKEERPPTPKPEEIQIAFTAYGEAQSCLPCYMPSKKEECRQNQPFWRNLPKHNRRARR